MKKIGLLALLMAFSGIIWAQEKETVSKKGKTLIFVNQDPDLNPEVKEGLIKTYFKVYPKMSKDFNPLAIDTIEVTIDTAYTGVAYANNGKITISSAWLRKKPEDLDVITHETFHIVQAYPNNSGPGWLTEGIADYARFKYGVNNKKADWSLTEFSPEQNYENSYRIAARFLYWLIQNYDKNIVHKLDTAMRDNTFSPELWKEYTGKSLDELWDQYSKNPKLS